MHKPVSAICTGGYRVEGKVNGVSVLFSVDSEASATLIRKDVWERVNTLQQELSGWTGSSLVGVDTKADAGASGAIADVGDLDNSV